MTTQSFESLPDDAEFLRVDSRGRVNLSRFTQPGQKYLGRCEDDGTVVLRPAVVMTAQQFQALAAPVETRPPGEPVM